MVPSTGRTSTRPGRSPEEASRLGRGMEDLPSEEKLREFALFISKKKRLRGDLVAAFQYIQVLLTS